MVIYGTSHAWISRAFDALQLQYIMSKQYSGHPRVVNRNATRCLAAIITDELVFLRPPHGRKRQPP